MNDVYSLFVDADEEMVAVFGEKYFHKFLEYGFSGKGFCVLSDRRLYCCGKCYHKVCGLYVAHNCRYIINVGDVACTGTNSAGMAVMILLDLFFAGVWLLLVALSVAAVNTGTGYPLFSFRDVAVISGGLLIFALASGILYFHRKKTELFVIQYAGNEVAFLTLFYPRGELMNFEKKLHVLKNKFFA